MEVKGVIASHFVVVFGGCRDGGWWNSKATGKCDVVCCQVALPMGRHTKTLCEAEPSSNPAKDKKTRYVLALRRLAVSVG